VLSQKLDCKILNSARLQNTKFRVSWHEISGAYVENIAKYFCYFYSRYVAKHTLVFGDVA